MCWFKRENLYPILQFYFLYIACSSPWLGHATEPLTQGIPLLNGYFTIGNQQYQATCECRGNSRLQAQQTISAIECNPQKILILEESGTTGLNVETLRKLYGQPRDILVLPQDSHMLSCMDDRLTRPSLISPGGDLGEFLLGLFVFNTLRKNSVPLQQKDIESILLQYLSKMPNHRFFYHCTDEEALSHIENSLGVIGLDLNTPPTPALKHSLLEQLIHPRNQGDFHLRSILQNPERYHLTKELVSSTVSAFYTLLWEPPAETTQQLYLDILPGKRSPEAFVEIDEGESCHQARKAPLMQPRKKRNGITSSVLMIHSGVMTHRRRQMATFLLELAKTNQLPVTDQTQNDIYQRLEKYGLEWLEATLSDNSRSVPLDDYGLSYKTLPEKGGFV